jgi:hypothetical protein
LHQPEDTIVMRWKSALSISLAITASEAGVRPLRQEISHCREKHFDSVGALHIYLAVAFRGP